jgi:hypothetical protein
MGRVSSSTTNWPPSVEQQLTQSTRQADNTGVVVGNAIWLPGLSTPASWPSQTPPHGSTGEYMFVYWADYSDY